MYAAIVSISGPFWLTIIFTLIFFKHYAQVTRNFPPTSRFCGLWDLAFW